MLQETVIVRATRGGQARTVRLSSSVDHRDEPVVREVACEQVVTEDFVFVPATQEDAQAVEWMGRAGHTLASLGLAVSTGRVVDFRLRDYLVRRRGSGAAPMVYSANIAKGRVLHPRDAVTKPQWFRADSMTASRLLVPAGTYVLVKRFSAKEERRRLVAAVWSGEGDPAFDNKLNYIHQQGRGLDPEVASGLATWLGSKQVDDYFRVFSGHTQVNAGDLRRMRFPSLEQLRLMGRSTLSPEEAVEKVMTAERARAA